MAKTVVGMFNTLSDGQNAIQELIDNGFRKEDISLIAHDGRNGKTGIADNTSMSETGKEAGKGAAAGAVGGGVLGGVLGLLVGIGALAIPGIGPILAAGPLVAALGAAGASTLVGAGVGAAAGGLVGALVGAGIPEADANFYAEGVRRGGTLVTVSAADNLVDRAADIMQRHGAVDIDERLASWQQSGWTRFDESSEPLTAEEIERYNTGTVSSRQVGQTQTGTRRGQVRIY